ncbi:MAG TPA: fibro-slime domain-containing protein [Polyangiaceae bacterium]|nr:fibro-slime domain-containing protein [Polyangiaceae bacterium]
MDYRIWALFSVAASFACSAGGSSEGPSRHDSPVMQQGNAGSTTQPPTGGMPSIMIDAGSGDTDAGMGARTCDGKLKGVVRDFSMQHPDFEVLSHDSSKCYCSDRGMVADALGDDRRPVYAGDPTTGTPSTTGKTSFDQWFHDTDGVNQSLEIELQFVDQDGTGLYSYDNQAFFPIDELLLGNEGKLHNFHFTFELHTEFIYRGGERFTFVGDDDVFTFINGIKVADLGGIHAAETAIVELDVVAPMLGLTPGGTYPLDFFFAERHMTESHFRMDTSLEFIDCGTIVK